MIPKTIHYCWFGGNEKPELAEKCIASWKKYCPDYTLVEWNENSFDINSNEYVRQAYAAKKYAFVSDYVRLYALYHSGGVYMDTDVMVLKSLDEYLIHAAFSGFESVSNVPTGIMASIKRHELIGEFLAYYDDAKFIRDDGSYNMTTNVEIITSLLKNRGLVPNGEYQEVENMVFYPQNVFCPDTRRLDDPVYVKNTATIHWFAGSWKSDTRKKRESSAWYKWMVSIYRVLLHLFGEKIDIIKDKISRVFFNN